MGYYASILKTLAEDQSRVAIYYAHVLLKLENLLNNIYWYYISLKFVFPFTNKLYLERVSTTVS